MEGQKSCTLDDAIKNTEALYKESLSLLAAYGKEVGDSIKPGPFPRGMVGKHCDNILRYTASVKGLYESLQINGLEFSDDSLRLRILKENLSLENAINNNSKPNNVFNVAQNNMVYAQGNNIFTMYVLLSIAKKRNLRSILPAHISTDKRSLIYPALIPDFPKGFEKSMEQIAAGIPSSAPKP
ncbi:hypothetical protein HYV84_03325 [Candidatus Woesearchaeota archaeon]|nr:hypothetical protein [Candidatus Woesearchaeota archaeon]